MPGIAHLAPSVAPLTHKSGKKLGELLPRIVANNREIEYINGHVLPRNGKRLLVAELVARGLEGFVKLSLSLAAHKWLMQAREHAPDHTC